MGGTVKIEGSSSSSTSSRGTAGSTPQICGVSFLTAIDPEKGRPVRLRAASALRLYLSWIH